jgi:hypothetical protein
MSIWHTVKESDDVQLSDDKKTLEVLLSSDHNGNNYIEIPVEFVIDKISVPTTVPKIADLKKQVTEHFNSENIILDNIKDEISEKEYEYRKAELKRQKFYIMLILVNSR